MRVRDSASFVAEVCVIFLLGVVYMAGLTLQTLLAPAVRYKREADLSA